MPNGWLQLQIDKMTNTNSVIHPNAKIGKNSTIGNFCQIGEEVIIGENCEVMSHANIQGVTSIGSGNIIYPFASIGTNPQDLKYKGEKTKLIIGNNNTIREHVTINTGTVQDKGITTVGNNCLLMIGSHIAHDCSIGNSVILANNVAIAGHCLIDDEVIIGGNSAVQQFCSLGKGAMIGGMTGVDKSVLPYTLAMGNRCYFENLNLVGLKRKGHDTKIITEYRDAIKIFFEDRRKIDSIKASKNPLVIDLLDFLTKNVNKQLCVPLT
jgi:UDP-N-acetylglucosamine acyltransferase